ncbi:RNA-binding protein [Thermanaerothrix daxensis]|uniref:RNA-binding protein KhpA n=1 Tax=Thermanaerothrix daxensis TaxID=869279 RepID=A0A0P6YCI8_9CHLR|nr:KH domain-containing protein [Thermanaerothrix daxensis]KPL82753.1 RNA-binding protein [Thermanaerothrix daxensis]
MRDLVEYIARALVDDPSQVEVRQERLGGNRVRVELHVSKQDMGRVIGKNGRVANAMRVLLRVAAAREGKQATLDVVDPR